MVEKVDFLLHVVCMTYNQASYIGDTMNGFCMQQTNFPFVCLIVDDASTDGESDVIKKYLDDNFDRQDIGLLTPDETDEYVRIYARHKENKNCYFCVLLLKYNHYSIGKAKTYSVTDLLKSDKYIAMCEGDDYWIDPLKLQKQVDFMENNPDFAICFHNVKVWKQKEGVMVDDFITKDVPSETDIYDIIRGNYIHTPSILFRRNDIVSSDQRRLGYSKIGDFPQWVLRAQYGKIKKLPDCMAVYRFGSGFWSADNRENKILEALVVYKNFRIYFKNKKLLKIIRQINFNLYGELSKIYYVQKKYFKSYGYLITSFVHLRTFIDFKTWVKNYLFRK